MSSKIKSPTQKSNAFAITLVAVLALVAAVIGYVVYSGMHSKQEAVQASLQKVDMDISTADTFITLKGKNAAADAKQVDLFEDYSCPHCAELAEATDGKMKDQIEAGKLIVNIHPLDFLDNQQLRHSSLAGAAALAIAEQGDASLYWNYRAMLFAKQRDIAGRWKPADFASAAKTMGADSKTVDEIAKENNLESFRKEAEANSDKLEKATGKVSSPQVLIDGKAVNLTNEAGTGFADWPKEVVDGSMRFVDAPAAEKK